MRHRDLSALQHLPALYNKRNYCIQVHVYLFVWVHVHLSVGLTVMHILNWAFDVMSIFISHDIKPAMFHIDCIVFISYIWIWL